MFAGMNRKGRAHPTARALILFLALLLSASVTVSAMETEDASEDAPAFETIAYGAQGEEVLALQTRLMELSYFQGGKRFNPTLYDEATQEAIEKFCETNGITYSGSGVSPVLQSLIFADGAVPFSPPQTKATIQQKFMSYMKRDVSMLGGTLPMFVIWLFSVALIILILILAIYFFVPERGAFQPPAEPEAAPPQYWRKAGSTGGASPTVLTQEKVHGASSQELAFQIQYGEKIYTVRCSYPPAITIGRKNCTITLDADDHAISSSHCELYLRGMIMVLKDHSTNGTLVNGRLIHNSECRMNRGDLLTIGSHRLYIQ